MMLIAATLEELLCIRVLRQIASVISHSLFPSSSHHYNPLCFVSFFQHNLFQPHPHLRFPHTKCLTSQGQKRPYFESWSAHTIWSRYAGLDMEEVRSLSPLLQTRSIVRTSPPFLRCVPELSTQEEFIHPAVCKLGCCPLFSIFARQRGEINISSHTFFRLSLRPFRAVLIASPKALKSYRGTGLFAIFIHPVTFYCSPFFLDISTLFYQLAKIIPKLNKKYLEVIRLDAYNYTDRD